MKRLLIALLVAFALLAMTSNHPLTTITQTFARTLTRDAAHLFFRSIR